MNRLATLADHEPRKRALSKVDAGLVIFREAAPRVEQRVMSDLGRCRTAA